MGPKRGKIDPDRRIIDLDGPQLAQQRPHACAVRVVCRACRSLRVRGTRTKACAMELCVMKIDVG
eukprot:5156078-Pyramimonas_sp.AAC.2